MQDAGLEIGGLFINAFISSTIAPGGSEAVLAYMVAAGHQAEFLVIVATIGNTLGAITTWGLGVLAAKRMPVAALLSEKKRRALEIVKKRGIWTLFFTWLPIVGDVLCFAGGWLRLPFLQACSIILLGKFCRYAMIAWMFA